MSIRHATHYPGSLIEGTSITGSYVTALALTDDVDILMIGNSCDVPLYLRVPEITATGASATKEIPLVASQSLVIDYRGGEHRLANGNIGVKHAGSAPTMGHFTVTGIR